MRRCSKTDAGARGSDDLGCFRFGLPCREPQGSFHVPTEKSLGYGELAAAAAALKTPKPEDLTLKDPSQFRYIGKGQVQIIDMFDITTGKAMYAQDIHVPGMKFAVVAGRRSYSARSRRSTKRPP